MALAMTIEATEDAPLGLEFASTMTFEQWELEGRRLSQMSHALQWYIGDWWNAGVKFGDEKRSDTAKRLFGIEYQTVRNIGSVCSRVPLSRRRDNLSFSHHAELAAIDDEGKVEVLAQQVQDQGLSVQALRREIQALKASNDPDVGVVSQQPVERTPLPDFTRQDLVEAYSRYVEAMEALTKFRKLSSREADYLCKALDFIGESYADRRPPPDDFDVVFVEQGRPACEGWYNASRITITRWLRQRGMRRLIDERASYVKHQRTMGHQAKVEGQEPLQIDTYLPVAKMAADFLRIRRNGGWMISIHECGGWRVGTVQRTSEQLIAMAVNQGFDRDAAVAEARAEGY